MTRPRTAISYRLREARVLDDLATRTIADARASDEDLAEARARLIPTREAFDPSRLSVAEIRTLHRLLAKGLGRAVPYSSSVELGPPLGVGLGDVADLAPEDR